MINVSNDFKKRMKESRDFKSYAEVSFPDGSTITLDSSQFTVANNSLVDGVGVSGFPLGVAIQKYVQLEILNDGEQYEDYDFVGAKIRLYTDFQLDEINPFAGENLILQSATKKLNPYAGANLSFETGVSVGEWNATDAIRVHGTGGTSAVIATLATGKSLFTQDGENYTHSIYIKNQGSSAIRISNNSLSDPLGRNSKNVAPGETLRVILHGTGNGVNYLQLVFLTLTVGESFDFVYWHPKIETGTKATDWTLAPKDIRTERIEKGTYTVVTPETYGETIIITAYDDMYKADKDYTTKLVFPQTVKTTLRDICSTCGISLGSTSFLHDDFVIQEKPAGTFREVIGYISMIACGNARIDRRNALQVIPYDFSGLEGDCYTLEEWDHPKIEYNNTIITGFSTTIKGSSPEEDTEIKVGTDVYVVVIENPLILGREQSVLSWLLECIGNVPFRPFSGDLVANPLIEFMDLVQVKDRRGRTYPSFVTDVNFTFLGNTTVSNTVPGMARSAMKYETKSAKVEMAVRRLVAQERTDRELAIEGLANKLSESSGLYITTEKQPDGSSIYYMHNKPTLAESDIIWKITAEAFGISTDGGNTYPFGFQVTGEMIAKLLSVDGINASWINTGVFQVSDEDHNEIMYVDVDTGVVRINAQSLTIAGEAIASEQFVSDKLQSLNALNVILSNDYYSIPVDAQGVIPSGALAGADTTVTVLWGTQDITSKVKIVITESTGLSGSWTDASKEYAVTSLTTDNGWADFSVTYNGINVVKRYTIVKRYPGADGEPGKSFQLDCSANTVKRAQYGELLPHYLDFNGYYFDTSAIRQAYAGRFVVEESVDGTTWSTQYTSGQDEASLRYHFYRPIVTAWGKYISDAAGKFLATRRVSDDVLMIRCTLYAAGGTSSIIDRQTISIITDAAALSSEDYFNLLTDNGRIQGIFMRGDQLFINGEYVQTRGLKAVNQQGQTTFYVNDQGDVQINAQSLSIAGLSGATQAYADDQAEQALNTGKVYAAGQAQQAYEDSKTYADSVGNAINQEEIFNRLFSNGKVQGISLQKVNGQYRLYINAEYINTGQLVGITIKSSDGNVEIGSNGKITSKNSGGSLEISGPFLSFTDKTASDRVSGFLMADGTYSMRMNAGSFVFRKGNSNVLFNLQDEQMQILVPVYIDSKVEITGNLTLSSNSVVSIKNLLSNTTGNSPNVYAASNGTLQRSASSSQRYKEDVKPVCDIDYRKILDSELYQYRYKKEYLSDQNTKIGFIVEQLQEAFPEAVQYENGLPEMWNINIMFPALVKVVQDQQKEIEDLKKRLNIVEKLQRKDDDNGRT